MVTTGFFVGYAPTAVYYTVFASGCQMDSTLSDALSNAVDCMFAVSLCFNPILYAFRSKNFREGFKRIILRRKQTPQNEIQLQ